MEWRTLTRWLRHMVRTEVERVLRIQMSPRLGNVMAYDPKLHAVQVALQPEGDDDQLDTTVEPLGRQRLGNGCDPVDWRPGQSRLP